MKKITLNPDINPERRCPILRPHPIILKSDQEILDGLEKICRTHALGHPHRCEPSHLIEAGINYNGCPHFWFGVYRIENASFGLTCEKFPKVEARQNPAYQLAMDLI